MKTFKTFFYVLAAIIFFAAIVDNFNLTGFAGAFVSYVYALVLKHNIKREAKQIAK
jgi:hypothetical protein